MTIGQNIKRLRRLSDITQEQLAEYLGISSRAISQWECEKTAPDISMLPLLADIFKVSTDELLGVDINKRDEKIKKVINTADEHMCNGDFQSAVSLLREGLKSHPSSTALMQALADAIINNYSRRGITDYTEVYSLCEKILAEAVDSEPRNKALRSLALAYSYANDKVNMTKTADKLPSFRDTRESFLMWHNNRGAAALSQNQEYCHSLLVELAQLMSIIAASRQDNGELVYTPDEQLRIHEQIVALIELLFPDGDYQILSQEAEIAAAQIAQVYLHRGDLDRFFYWFDKSCNFTVSMDRCRPDEAHTSPLLRGFADGGYIKENDKSRCQETYDGIQSDHELDSVRADPRFVAIVDKLKQYI